MNSQPADLHRELLPQKSEDWGYTSVAEPLPRRRKVMSMFSHQHWKSKTKPMFQYVNKWTSRNVCYVSAGADMGADDETALRTARWHGFLHWSSSELHSRDQHHEPPHEQTMFWRAAQTQRLVNDCFTRVAIHKHALGEAVLEPDQPVTIPSPFSRLCTQLIGHTWAEVLTRQIVRWAKGTVSLP